MLELTGQKNRFLEMLQITATEAKARLAELLRKVEHGETVAILRHGRLVAHLVPSADQGRTARKAAVERFRAARARADWPRLNATLEEVLAWRHAGHRY